MYADSILVQAFFQIEQGEQKDVTRPDPRELSQVSKVNAAVYLGTVSPGCKPYLQP